MDSAGLATFGVPNAMPFHIGGSWSCTLTVSADESTLFMSAMMHSGCYSSTLSEKSPRTRQTVLHAESSGGHRQMQTAQYDLCMSSEKAAYSHVRGVVIQ